jgi:hypothetical protein
MELVPVESSNVAAIGYNAECQLLRVRFRDGSTYDYPATSAEAHQRIMNAPSKGRAIAGCRGIKIGPVPETITLREPFVYQAQPLQTLQEDPCCARRLSKVLNSLATVSGWTCPKCGCEWRPQLVGQVRHWTPHEVIQVF